MQLVQKSDHPDPLSLVLMLMRDTIFGSLYKIL